MIDVNLYNSTDFQQIRSLRNCVIGLDRDGVINQDRGYIRDPQEFEPIPQSLQAVTKLKRMGYPVVVVSNQSGISKGILTSEDVDTVHNYMFKLLGEAGCSYIDALYYSTSSHKQDYYAKPNTGMFERCEKENPHLRFKGGYFVGDKISDLKAAIKINAQPILVRTGHGADTEQLLKRHTYKKLQKKTEIFDNLWQFSQQL